MSLARDTGLQAGRVLRRSMRMRPVLIQTIVFPALLMAVLLVVFGEVAASARTPGDDVRYVERLVPLMVLASALFGGLGSGASLVAERDAGLLARFATLPVHRASVLGGRVLGDAARTLLGAVVLVAAGHLAGFRFDRGALGAAGFFALVAVYGSAFSWLVTAVAVRARSYESVLALTPVLLVLFFLNDAVTPVDDYPAWMRPLVAVAPHSCAVRALLGLAHGGPVCGPVLLTLAWSAGITAVAGPVAVRCYTVAPRG